MEAKKIRENRRIKKLLPNHHEELPTYQFASVARNPVSRVFTWGNICYGALGNRDLIIPSRKTLKPLQTMHRPMRVSTLELKHVKDVACGYGYSVFACKA